MRRKHHQSLKIHTIFSLIIASMLAATVILTGDIIFLAASVLLIVYISGNGIIHSKKNQLSREALIEYIIVAAIVFFILITAIIH